MPQYLVGIDLGTTHTAVAYTDVGDPQKKIHLLKIMQMVGVGEIGERPLLPSVRYHPAPGELNINTGFLFADDGAVVGEAARVLGGKSHGRLVTSAKSWLSHSMIDRTAAVLPWGGDDSVTKVSPLSASAGYLAHVRKIWKQRFPDAPLSKQTVVITVPASFDESARSLTLEAAKIAGFGGDIRLLEEPQAVCYDWLHRHADELGRLLANRHLLLVCDIGGGTSDFTLVKIEHGSAEPKLTRIGVGEHLMLGGDNIDLALAHLIESRLTTAGKKFSNAELTQLMEQCRLAKETLLAIDAPDQISVTLLGSGSKLVAGSRSAMLSKEEVRQVALDGFFPLSGLDDLPDKKRSGVIEFGLPYASDPAVSKHIAAFLHLHTQAAKTALGWDSIVPDVLLLNGGLYRSSAMVQRTVDLLAGWQAGNAPLLLDNPYPELAVAYGAVSYALARRNKKIKISGGAPRSYFLLVDSVDGTSKHGVCLLPKGCEEGQGVLLADRQFGLRIGQPVRFHLLTGIGDDEYKAGDLVELTEERFHSLPPLAVVFAGESKQDVVVQLLATYTEMGVLQLQCVAPDGRGGGWDVEFQIRKQDWPTDVGRLPDQFSQGIEKIKAVFGAKNKQIEPHAVKTLRNDLEKMFYMSRHEWPTPLLRGLFATFLEGGKYRRRSELHERVWLSLTGFCLRPGFGDQLDDWRVTQLWKLYPEGLQFVNEKQNWTEWWTLWRRVAGGLSVEAQRQIFKDVAKFINPAVARQGNVGKQATLRGYEDMVRLAATLERLNVAEKCELGGWLLKRLEKAGEPEQSWWAVGRIGARILFYGNLHDVVPVATTESWIAQMMGIDWKRQPQCAFAATLLARRCDDRTRDIDENLRHRVIDKLKQARASASWVEMVAEFKQLDEYQEKQIFGEALPPGLKLIA